METTGAPPLLPDAFCLHSFLAYCAWREFLVIIGQNSMSSTAHLFERFYFSRPEYTGGTRPFHNLIASRYRGGTPILEIGSGPSNETSRFLAKLGPVVGLDIEAAENDALSEFHSFNGTTFPLDDCSFELCVSRYVLEHVKDAEAHFREVARVLQPGGFYCFTTPNLRHYIPLASHMTPHWFHEKVANRSRCLPEDAHDPYPTLYRANTRSRIRRLCNQAGLRPLSLETIECEPVYGSAHPLLFYPMMAYERFVNRFQWAAEFRINILGVIAKPQ